MKKISLILASLCGATLVACNSGSDNNNTVAPSGCPDGAAQCGATSGAIAYNEQFPNATGSLISANNIVVAGESEAHITFNAKGITAPVDITFSGDNGIGTQTHTFDPTNKSYDFTFQADNNVNYTIIPSVNGENMLPITVKAIESTSFLLPLGTYKSSLVTGSCSYTGGFYINTINGTFSCAEGACGRETDTRDPEHAIPSYDNGYSFNVSWNNGTYTEYDNEYGQNVLIEDCGSSLSKITLVYQSSSTTPPYPIENDNQLSKKAKSNHSIFGAKFTK